MAASYHDNRRPYPIDEEDGLELYSNLYDVASATECTGLTPSAPLDTSEIEAYSDIYDIPLAVESGGKYGRRRD